MRFQRLAQRIGLCCVLSLSLLLVLCSPTYFLSLGKHGHPYNWILSQVFEFIPHIIFLVASCSGFGLVAICAVASKFMSRRRNYDRVFTLLTILLVILQILVPISFATFFVDTAGFRPSYGSVIKVLLRDGMLWGERQ